MHIITVNTTEIVETSFKVRHEHEWRRGVKKTHLESISSHYDQIQVSRGGKKLCDTQ